LASILRTHFQGITLHVVAIQLDQVEGVEEGVTVMASVADTVERGNAVIATHNRLPIDDAGCHGCELDKMDGRSNEEGPSKHCNGTAASRHQPAQL